MPAKIYDFTLTANGSFSLQVQGGFYKIMTASAQVSVTRDSAGALEGGLGSFPKIGPAEPAA